MAFSASRNVSHELAFAGAQLTKAHGRLEGFLISGITPDDLRSGPAM